MRTSEATVTLKIPQFSYREASQGLRVGSTTLSRQTVSSALAAALESCQSTQNISDKEKKVKKLMFTLDALTSVRAKSPILGPKCRFTQIYVDLRRLF